MFATLLGFLPRPPLGPDARDRDLLEAAVRAQEAAGIEPITDGGFGVGESPVDRWRVTASLTTRAVKQTLIGPYSAGRTDPPAAGAAAREAATLASAAALNAELRALASAGCPLVEIHERAAIEIGTDPQERAHFSEAQRRLLDGVQGPHLSLAITGGNADAAGVETLLSAGYASLALDLIAGPNNWRLVVAAPGDRGIVCGVLSIELGSDDRPELPLWAAAYAASTGGRGPARVGLATAGSLAGIPWEAAVEKLGRLGEAVRLANLPPDERRRSIDPRAVDSRSAALGRVEPHRPRRRRAR